MRDLPSLSPSIAISVLSLTGVFARSASLRHPRHGNRTTRTATRNRPTSPGGASREEYTAHAIFFPAGIAVIEYLTNLDRVVVPRCRFMGLPLALEGADGSPVRAIAIIE